MVTTVATVVFRATAADAGRSRGGRCCHRRRRCADDDLETCARRVVPDTW